MKHLLGLAVLFCAAVLPISASAQIPLADSQVQRQRILDLEYWLNIPGLPSAQADTVNNEVIAIQTQVNGPDLQPLSVPNYGGCAADQSILSYLQDEVANAGLDKQTLYSYNRNIYDLEVNLRQRGC
jgi:hypothetical protein